MHSGLNKLLKDIDPKVTIDDVERKVNKAVQAFKGKSFSNYDDFTKLIGEFYQHVYNQIYCFDNSYKLPPGHDIGYANEILSFSYGHNNPLHTAYEIARTGVEGGLRQILSDLANQIAQKESTNWIRIRVLKFWNELSPNEWDDVADSYIDKFGHLFPSDVLEGEALRIRQHLPDILMMHPDLVRGIRNIAP